MGIEDFVVRLEINDDRSVAVEKLLRASGIVHDMIAPKVTGCEYLRYEDSEHIVELDVGASDNSTSALTIRFALCQPPTVDSIFIGLVERCALSFSANVVIADDIDPSDPPAGLSFHSPELDGLSEALSKRIMKRREVWQAEFGRVVARLSCREAVERYIIARG
jgi:hypothetical protein